MKVSELTGAILDYWVARCEGFTRPLSQYDGCPYSSNWAYGGIIIEREHVHLAFEFHPDKPAHWHAMAHAYSVSARQEYSDASPLVAAMRVHVGSTYGPEVPDEVRACNT